MAENTKIQWTDATFNPWRGCTKVSPGCAHCYAEALSKRNPSVLGEWGPQGKRVIASEQAWRDVLAWNRKAGSGECPDCKGGREPETHESGYGYAICQTCRGSGNIGPHRRRVFCASLADVFEDRPELDAPRQRLFDLILQTPNLDWLLLTKRPEVMADYLTGSFCGNNAHAWGNGWPNVWLGVSVEDQQRAKERIPILLSVPAAVHWLSCEPLLGPLDIEDYIHVYHGNGKNRKAWPHGHVSWVIAGGESGAGSRGCEVAWLRSLAQQCRSAGCACFVKQLGAAPIECGGNGACVVDPAPCRASGGDCTLKLKDKKGGDITEFPADLRVREFPQ
jgi:protein gp37